MYSLTECKYGYLQMQMMVLDHLLHDLCLIYRWNSVRLTIRSASGHDADCAILRLVFGTKTFADTSSPHRVLS